MNSCRIHLPKALLEGSVNESGSSAVLPVAAHVPDAQFSITLVPTAPMHPPKPIVDGRKKKRGFGGRIDDKSGPSTPTKSSQPSDARNMGGQSQFRTVTASAVVKKEVAAIVRPPPVHPVKMFPNAALKPVTSSMQGRPVAGGGTPKLTPFGVKPPMGAVRPSVSAAATTTPKPVATYVPVATSAVKSNHPLVTTPSAVMPPAPLAAVRPSAPAALEAVQPPPPAAIATAAPAPASISDPDTNTIPKSFPVSKELASLIGIPLPRNSASPIPATPPADVDSVEASGDNSATAKKRKRDEDYTGSVCGGFLRMVSPLESDSIIFLVLRLPWRSGPSQSVPSLCDFTR